MPGAYKGDPTNAFFVCGMEGLMAERRPALWVHGHTHESVRYTTGATTVLCNPLGYPDEENASFGVAAWPARR